jgi:hypothetical protein
LKLWNQTEVWCNALVGWVWPWIELVLAFSRVWVIHLTHALWLLSGLVVPELLAIYTTPSDDGMKEDGPTIVINKGNWVVTQYEVIITQPDWGHWAHSDQSLSWRFPSFLHEFSVRISCTYAKKFTTNFEKNHTYSFNPTQQMYKISS